MRMLFPVKRLTETVPGTSTFVSWRQTFSGASSADLVKACGKARRYVSLCSSAAASKSSGTARHEARKPTPWVAIQ